MPPNDLLSPSSSSPRRSPSRQGLNKRRSTASLRGDMDDFATPNGHHSLAHELAAALMPEPSTGSKLLAEEFGIEYDEGAEGIDEEPLHPHIVIDDQDTISSDAPERVPDDYDPAFGSPQSARAPKERHKEQDAIQVLAQDLESTDKFLAHLRSIDVDGQSQQPSLEQIASNVIRRLNESTRDREGQVRELLEYEREFRKIAGEVGGGDVLSQLDELVQMDDLLDVKPSTDALEPVNEEPSSQDWEADPDLGHQDDEDLDVSAKDTFLPPPPPVNGPPTPATTIPQLTHLRSFTTSLVNSLTTISEHAQVNGVATTEAGRKIRALKNKLGEWRTDWDSAEQSRLKIEKWEAGSIASASPESSPMRTAYRVDGRDVVQQHLAAFELALADAVVKTQAIMAPS